MSEISKVKILENQGLLWLKVMTPKGACSAYCNPEK